MTHLAISLIKNRLQDTYGRRLKFVSGGTSYTSPTSQTAEKSGTRVTRPSEPSISITYGSRLKFVSGSGSGGARLSPAAARPSAEAREVLSGHPPAAEVAAAGDSRAPENVSLLRIIGEPPTPIEAATLAEEDKFQFQWWALGLGGARPVEQKKGADHGIDGKILFRDNPKAAQPEQIIIQVKRGKTGVKR